MNKKENSEFLALRTLYENETDETTRNRIYNQISMSVALNQEDYKVYCKYNATV
jgi:hypothetical protein